MTSEIPRVLLCGIPSEPPLAMVARALEGLGVPYLMFNQREFGLADCDVEVGPAGIGGVLTVCGREFALDAVGAVYTRMMDYQLLPELREVPSDSPLYKHCRRLHETILRWCEIMPGRVVNRSRPMGSNASKPYQAQVIRKHFAIPDTLVTNDVQEVLAFREKHSRIVYKSISGVRSVVREFSSDDVERLAELRWCPVQFQEYVPGLDVRVHAIGQDTFATAVRSEAIDYRYGHWEDHPAAALEAVAVSAEVAHSCVRLTHDLRLDFAGIDLRLTEDGTVYCFEVNPSPAYSYYQVGAGQPISETLARYLAYLD